jgi:hypothetical protein
VSAGNYGLFKRITNPQADSYRDRFHTFGEGEIAYDAEDDLYLIDENQDGSVDYSISNPDFNYKDFNSNLVFRWEYSAGSSLYAVWSQSRTGYSPSGDFAVGGDLEDLFDVHPHNVFLLKINRWLNI